MHTSFSKEVFRLEDKQLGNWGDCGRYGRAWAAHAQDSNPEEMRLLSGTVRAKNLVAESAGYEDGLKPP